MFNQTVYEPQRTECDLKIVLNVTEKSGNLRKDLKQDIVDSVSILRKFFFNLKNSGEEQTIKIDQLEGELNKVKAELRDSRVANLTGRALQCRGRIGQTPTSSMQNQLPSFGGANKLYSEAVNTSVDKRYKLLVRSKLNLSTEAFKNTLKKKR